MNTLNHQKNYKRFKNVIDEDYDGALLYPGANLYYLTGLDPKSVLERPFLLIMYSHKESVLIAPKMYEKDVSDTFIKEVCLWKDTENPYEILRSFLHDMKNEHERILIEDKMPAFIYTKLQDHLKEYDLELLNDQTAHFRIKKSKKEIDLMQKAAEIADETFYRILQEDLKGMTEKEVVSLIDYYIIDLGGEKTAFQTIVASGPNGANPHHYPSERELEEGDLVIIDYGAVYKGYCSDISRTIAIGDVSPKKKEVYDLVRKALKTASDAVEVGIELKEIDIAARDVIKRGGYGENFIHRVGHGLGLAAHEEPYLTSTTTKKIKNRMTFTIEPGIYLKDEFGVRIEDDIMVDKKGKSLTKADRDLKII